MISYRKLIRLTGGLLLAMALILVWGCVEVDTEFDFGNSGVKVSVNRSDYNAEETVAFKLPIVNHRSIRLESISGDIEIEGRIDGVESITVSARKWVGSNSVEDAELHLKEIEIRVTDQDDEVILQTLQPDNTVNREFIVDYLITLPSNLEIDVNHINGDIIIQGIESSVWVDSVNSNLYLSNMYGNVDLNLTNGSINSMMAVPAHREIRFATGNGDLNMSIPVSTSARLFASVVNGTISTSHLEMETILQTPQSLTGVFGSGEGLIELSVVNGNINLIGLN